jgi:hypothetical protein
LRHEVHRAKLPFRLLNGDMQNARTLQTENQLSHLS